MAKIIVIIITPQPLITTKWASQVALVIKYPPTNAGDIRDSDLISGLGRSPGGGNPLQYSSLKEPLDRGVWWAAVHRITKSQTPLKQLNSHPHNHKALFLAYVILWQKVGSGSVLPCPETHPRGS